MSEFDEVMAEFLIESREGLDQLDRDLVALEETPDDRELLARVFRCFHTIKGTSGFLGFSKLEHLTHAGESLLSLMREGKLLANGMITSALLETIDAVRYMLGEVEAGGNDGDNDFAPIAEKLHQLAKGEVDAPPPAPCAERVPAHAPAPEPVEATNANPPRAANQPAAQTEEAAHDVRPGVASEGVRVDVEMLNRMVDLAGELVLTRNHLLQLSKNREDAALVSAVQRLNLVTAQLQTRIMSMRMQPVSTLFTKFPRVVRDLGRACGKQLRLEIRGADTELDKSLLAAIKDPLTHMIRNCVDHGIELPDARVAAGKPVEGRLVLRSYHQNGMVHIELEDDGAGVRIDKVKSKAVANGLLTEERAAALSDSEAINLIFMPGFSTVEEVTSLSGRGVGMDVVKTNVEQLGGTTDVTSRPGHGTTFTLKIPLTLAIVPALVIESDGDRYAIPQVNVLELVRLDGVHGSSVEWIHSVPVFRLRGMLMPIVFLSQALGHTTITPETAPPSDEDAPAKHLIVLQAGGQQFGLVVGSVLDHQEIVVKPLPKLIRDVRAFAGATLLGDGRVALILDVLAIAERANLIAALRESANTNSVEPPKRTGDATTLLLMRGPDDERLAVVLNSVARLEMIECDKLEPGGRYDMVQYRGHIMPLLRPEQLLPERRSRPRHTPNPQNAPRSLSVVVFGLESRPVGIVVEDVIDVIDTTERPKRLGCRDGVQGTLIVQERVTEVLDLGWLAEAAGLQMVATIPPEAAE